MGLQRVRVLDQEIEALAIEYAGGEILRVPVYRLDLIERNWSDGLDHAPFLRGSIMPANPAGVAIRNLH